MSAILTIVVSWVWGSTFCYDGQIRTMQKLFWIEDSFQVSSMALLANISFDDHTEPHDVVTSGQLTFFTIWIASGFIWLLRFIRSSDSLPGDANGKQKLQNGLQHNGVVASTVGKEEVAVKVENDSSATEVENKDVVKAETRNFSAVRAPPTIDEFLQSVIAFGIIMIYFYLCDYRKVGACILTNCVKSIQ